MSVVSNIIDALRRVGSTAEKAALLRQDRQLEGRKIIERTYLTARLNGETATGIHAVVDPLDEKIRFLDDDEVALIRRNAALAASFFEAFDIDASEDSLDKLDRSFEEWICSSEQRDYSGEAVVEILGACFGEYCNDALVMRWVSISDCHGTCLAVEGIDVEFRAFPYHSIEKRITDGEHTFFRGIYILLADQKQRSRLRASD